MDPTELEQMLMKAGPPGAAPQPKVPGFRVVVHESADAGFGGIDLFPGALKNPGWDAEMDRVLLLVVYDALGPTANLVRFQRQGLINLVGSALDLADEFTLDAVAEKIETRRAALAEEETDAASEAEPERESKIVVPR